MTFRRIQRLTNKTTPGRRVVLCRERKRRTFWSLVIGNEQLIDTLPIRRKYPTCRRIRSYHRRIKKDEGQGLDGSQSVCVCACVRATYPRPRSIHHIHIIESRYFVRKEKGPKISFFFSPRGSNRLVSYFRPSMHSTVIIGSSRHCSAA